MKFSRGEPNTNKEALELWLTLPAHIRQLLLGNVYCGGCQKSTTIVDYHTEMHGVVVLKGFCGTCGHKVSRVIDDLAPAPLPKATRKGKAGPAKHYIFDVWLYGDEECTKDNRIIRRIRIPGGKTLYNLAGFIIKSFDFSFDHCFGFYDTLKDKKNCKKAFELFVDIGEGATRSCAKGVKKTRVSEAFDRVGESLIFLFDYGDGWQFHVDCIEIHDPVKGQDKPVVLKSTGVAPDQYSSFEE